jgi:hypothetical protein
LLFLIGPRNAHPTALHSSLAFPVACLGLNVLRLLVCGHYDCTGVFPAPAFILGGHRSFLLLCARLTAATAATHSSLRGLAELNMAMLKFLHSSDRNRLQQVLCAKPQLVQYRATKSATRPTKFRYKIPGSAWPFIEKTS